jgi:hypothetical protein
MFIDFLMWLTSVFYTLFEITRVVFQVTKSQSHKLFVNGFIGSIGRKLKILKDRIEVVI